MLSNAAYNLMETASVLSKGLQPRTLLPHLKQHLEHEPTVAAAA